VTDQPKTREAVASVLSREGPLPPSELAERIDRTPRAIRYALRELEEEGFVAWRRGPSDPRYRYYQWVAADTATPRACCGETKTPQR
jgi:DNA-binding MarR family transcriptional regulator